MIERKGEREKQKCEEVARTKGCSQREEERERESALLCWVGFLRSQYWISQRNVECWTAAKANTPIGPPPPPIAVKGCIIYTQRHTNMQTYLCTRLYFGLYHCTLTHWLLALLLCSHIQHIPLQKQSTPAEDIIFRKLSWLYRPRLGITVNRDSFIY